MAIDFEKLVLGPCLTTFGEAVTYRPLVSSPGAAPFAITGIFDAEHDLVEEFEGIDHSTQGPVLAVRLSDFPAPPEQLDQLIVRGQLYQVYDVRPDGQGKADLILKVDA